MLNNTLIKAQFEDGKFMGYQVNVQTNYKRTVYRREITKVSK